VFLAWVSAAFASDAVVAQKLDADNDEILR
jgi:hypothetical protein